MNVKRISWVLAAALAVFVAGTAQVAWAAVDAFLVIKGEKQGQIGSATSGAGAGKVTISDFKYTAAPPQDKATGATAGRRMHGTIAIVREVDKASPLLMKAMTTNEVLTSVDIMFTHAGAKGPEVYKSMHLTNAMITSIKPASSGGGAGKTEEITITAESQNIEMRAANGGKMAMDAWDAK
jgi:type VI secretion system secreted protein Hcp